MMKSIWQKAWPHVTVIVIFLLIAVFYCKPALEGKVLQQSDIMHWKGVSHQSFEYKEKYGHLPLWTNSMFAGMPAYQVAMERTSAISLDPLGTVLTFGLPKPISFFFLACLMFYILSQALRLSPWIGAACSIAYAYASFDATIIAVGHDSQMLSLGYAPGVLAGLFLLYDKKYWLGTALTIIFSGLLIAQTHQQIVYYTLLMMAAAGIAYAIKCIREKQIAHFFIANALAAIALTAGFASNAMGYLTTYEFAKESIRNGRTELTVNADGTKKEPTNGLDKEYAFGWSYGIGESFTVLIPGLYGGSNGGKELSSSGEFVKKLSDVGVPEENALQMANGSAYWGAQPFTQGTVYLGAVFCLLFVMGLLFIEGWQKWWMLGIAVLAFMMAWGKNFAGFNDFLFNHFPLYNKFRAPTMALVIPQLVFPLLGGLALQEILFGKMDKAVILKKFKLSAGIMGALLVLLGLFYFMADFSGSQDSITKQRFEQQMLQSVSQGKQPTADMQTQASQFGSSLIKALQADRRAHMGGDLIRNALFIAAVLGLIWLLINEKLKWPVVLAGILLLGTFDVLAIGRRYLNDDNFIDASESEAVFSPSPADNQIKADLGYFRVFDQSGGGDPFADARASYFHNSLGGYLAARLGLYQDIMDNQLKKGNQAVYNMLNTKYYIQENPANRQPVALLNQEAFGPCWLVKNIHWVKDGNEEMKALDSIDLKQNVIIQDKYKAAAGNPPAFDSSASLQFIRNSNDTILYKSKAGANQFAVFSEIYYSEGWNAYVDGKKTDYLRVNYALRGMPLPAGEHQVEFRFEPQSYKLGNTLAMIGSLLAYLMLLVAAFMQWKKWKTAA